MGKRKSREEEIRQPKKRKKKGHKLYAFIVLVLGIAIIALAVLILFYVQKIEVKGNDYCTDQQIIDTVKNDKYSINTLYILGKHALGYIEKPPCLKSMKLSLTAPWALKVTVKEKPIVGYVLAGDQYAYFDENGLVVLMGTEFIEGLPCIEGVDVGDVKLYKGIRSADKDIFKQILDTSREAGKYGLKTDKITCSDDQIYLYIGGVRVNLGNKVSSEQVAQIAPIIEKLEGKTGTLHLENYTEGSPSVTFTVEEPSEVPPEGESESEDPDQGEGQEE